jgi:acyl-CoA synthetase (AMP-forming)/AMP-acid ligase II
VLAGSIVQGRRLAEAKGRDIFDDESDTAKKYQYLGDILRWRASTSPDHCLYTVINSKVNFLLFSLLDFNLFFFKSQETHKLTCSQLHKKAERVGCLLIDKAQLNSGDHVALIFGPGADLIVAFYGCLYVGLIPVPIRPPHSQNIQTTLPTVKMVVEMSRTKAILTTAQTIKLFKSKVNSNFYIFFQNFNISCVFKRKQIQYMIQNNGQIYLILKKQHEENYRHSIVHHHPIVYATWILVYQQLECWLAFV